MESMDLQEYPWIDMDIRRHPLITTESLESVSGHFGVTLKSVWRKFGDNLDIRGFSVPKDFTSHIYGTLTITTCVAIKSITVITR